MQGIHRNTESALLLRSLNLEVQGRHGCAGRWQTQGASKQTRGSTPRGLRHLDHSLFCLSGSAPLRLLRLPQHHRQLARPLLHAPADDGVPEVSRL